ncbi:type VI secretion system tip protein VgrG [Campylobacter sp. TTU-622]|uniref:type VI secretion system Vgr family protein n=1 Tax=Campylobacter sp. TTU-622 TaxID=2800583 RepID=UPI0019081289|nr:type VI secretion system tip protein VgrG [Campylobacter sp. TTU-622]MBK1973646.1 type VI secretion system tip protein VgrG [Campylobacter sp. TTU-622]
MNSYLSLNIINPSASFKITKAYIKESLEDLFVCECEGYIEILEEDLINNQNTNFYPNSLIDQEAHFIIKNPYENKTINFTHKENKIYKGIISYVNYLGLSNESANNIVNSEIKHLSYKHFFKFTLTSVLARMSFNRANRIYTDLSILEVIRITLEFYQGKFINKEIDFSKLKHNYSKKELIVQYNESDLKFITRLAHNNGIYFYEDDEKIYFCDVFVASKHQNIQFNSNINNILNEPCIYSFIKESSIFPNQFTYSSANANYPLNLNSLNLNIVDQKNKSSQYYNEHIYESANSFTEDIDLKTPIYLKERRYKLLGESFKAKSNIYNLFLNDSININFNPSFTRDLKSEKKDFVIIKLEQYLVDDAILANSINTNDKQEIKDLQFTKSYFNIITFLPSHITYTPSFKPKPKAPSQTKGIVIGQNNEISNESNLIFTDKYGRVKVRFDAFINQEAIDKKENLYHHSCFLRISSPIASSHSGFFRIPRVGDEVLISFLENDIDKPFVSGSFYNENNALPLYSYPKFKREIANNTLNYLKQIPLMRYEGLPELNIQENKDYALNYTNNHFLTISNSTLGQENLKSYERNELTFKNEAGKEEIYLLAQKDYKEEITNNREQVIKNNKTSEIGGLFSEFIILGHMQNIAGFKNVNVGAEYLENTLLSKDTNVGLSNTLNVGVTHKVNIGQDCEEYIGNDKKVEIKNNFEKDISNDYIQRVGNNKNETIEGSYTLRVKDGIKIDSSKDISLLSKENLQIQAEDSLGFRTDKNCSFNADFVNFLANEENIIVAKKKAVTQIESGSAIIHTKKEVIIKVDGVEVIIDSNGLRIKGGDLRIE